MSLPVSSRSLRQQRTAWIVLIGAFAAFCVLCIGSGLGLRYFLLDSTVSLQGILTVGRGTVGLTSTDLIEQAVRYSREIANSSVVSTDRQSQAMLSFYDPQQEDRLTASVTLRSDTSLDLSAMTRPRFDLSGLGYEVMLSDVSGRLKVIIPDDLGRSMRVTVESRAGNWLTLTDSGEYFIDISPNLESLTNYGGSAALVSADGATTQYVADMQRGLFVPEAGEISIVPAPVSLIQQPNFNEQTVIESDGTLAQLLQPVWRCYSVANGEPTGEFNVVNEVGRTALNMVRGGGARTHGETLCSRTLNAGQGVDVSEFDTLSLDVLFRINSHSLSACGIDGSECPVMLRVDYIPVGGESATSWFHGFFVSFDPNTANPLVCASCTQEHEVVNANAWYSYQSDNLFSLLPANARPESIVNVVVYASGHEYDSLVASAELFGGTRDPLPEADTETGEIATETP
ncbi:MAG TPA: hypothetical protein VER79_08780 [Candidatus Limnocylindrales bacterium]|nr:hypothetical protein [Candidatus Limnocylindrales bacterium]